MSLTVISEVSTTLINEDFKYENKINRAEFDSCI